MFLFKMTINYQHILLRENAKKIIIVVCFAKIAIFSVFFRKSVYILLKICYNGQNKIANHVELRLNNCYN